MREILQKVMLSLGLFISMLSLSAQVFNLKGKITDEKNGEGLIGATVMVKGTAKGASTDFEGNYEIKGLAAGAYTLVASYISYKTKEIALTISEDQQLDIAMEENVKEITGVVVSTARRVNSEVSALSDTKNAEMVVNSVTAQTINKTPDRDVAQVIRRVPGITITDDRFVVVRGLANRYNTVMLNGVFAPSTEADSRAFSFDIVPSNFLDRLSVFKSGSPELPGEFAGAVIKLYTKNTVDENFTSINYTTGFRPGTSFRKFNFDPSGSADAYVMGKSKRELPASFPENLRNYSLDFNRLEAEGKKFENNFYVNEGTAIPDQRFRLDLGRLFKIGKVDVSSLNSFNYSNAFLRQDIERNRYINYNANGSDTEFDLLDDKSTNSVRMGLISNWAFNLNENDKLEFRNLISQQGTSELVLRSGTREARSFSEEQATAMRYQSRGIFTTQLSGQHFRNDGRSKLSWIAGITLGNRFEPDWRRLRARRPIGSDQPFQVDVPANASSQSASRFNTSLKENSKVASLDYEKKLGAEQQHIIRAGFYTETKAREFNARTIGYISTLRTSERILHLPASEILAPENISKDSGLVIAEGGDYTDFYTASNYLGAAYIGTSHTFGKLKLSGGLRGEYNCQQLETAPNAAGVPDKVDQPLFKLLPFINAGYQLGEKTQLRTSYGMTVNRPELRELAPFSYYNFDLSSNLMGNKALKTCIIQNLEARFEFYPSPSEIITFGTFYKSFKDPIEFIITTGSDNPIYINANAKEAYALGVEVEMRKSLGFFDDVPFWKNLNLVFNGSLIKSEINLGQSNLTQAAKRPLQGQSPYVLNTGLYYQSPSGFAASLLYNIYGKRIFLVGDNEFPTSYEMPRNVVDFSLAKKFGTKTEVRFTINDLLNSPYKVIEDANHNLKIDNAGIDKDIISTRNGSYYTLGITYKF